MDWRICVYTHNRKEVFLQYVIADMLPCIAEEFPIQSVKNPFRNVIDSATDSISGTKFGSKLFEHPSRRVENTAIVTVVSIRLSIPSGHSGLILEAFSRNPDSNAVAIT